ncbi:MAG: ATP-dependent DNA helicase RecG [Candidatus Bipolaricaulaceae bacterium]
MGTTKQGDDTRLGLMRKVLWLERRKGYPDQAAVGGLAEFVRRHLPEGAELVAGYDRMEPAARQQAVERLEELVVQLERGEGRPEELARPVEEATGVGKQRAVHLRKLGVETVEDLLTLFPRRLEDRSTRKPIAEVEDGESVTVEGVLRTKSRVRVRPHLELIKAAVDDGSGVAFAVWFNQPWLWRQLVQGKSYALFGQVRRRYGELQLDNPVWEPVGAEFHTGRWVPIYPATEGLSQSTIRVLIRRNLRRLGGRIPDVLPGEVRQRLNLMPRGEAIRRVHFPDGPADFERARRRLAFEELFLLQLGIARRQRRPAAGRRLEFDAAIVDRFEAGLPFSLTPSQRRALQAIAADLQSPQPMLRLLQGDVGSGKTAVAAGACAMAAAAGSQAAVMAPTEILAEQHYLVLRELLRSTPVRVGLLVGRTPPGARRRALAALARGQVDVVVGTHALIQEDVGFHDLGLAVVDEQHRFGVVQRAALEQKGQRPNILVMSATPIPRSVILTLYGEFAVSVLEEMPAPRQAVRTVWVSESRREEVYAEVGRWLARGEKGYVVFPLVEESEELDLRAATQAHAELARRFPAAGVGLLHGRMSAEDKRAAVADFREGRLRLLVATTVVEVGLDVPDASLMVIEHADRFGLAQLHQLRGRIGRGGQPAACYALADPHTEDGRRRLAAFRDLTDGFKIAEADLRIRGPGDVLGTAQHGFESRLRVADLVRDLGLLERARSEARRLIARGKVPEELEHEVERRFGGALELMGV